MQSALVASLVAGALLAATAAPATAQNLPGYAGDYDAADAQFRAYALEGFQRTLTGWTEAVRAGDFDEALRYYTDDTFVYLHDIARGRDQVEPVLRAWLDSLDDFRTGLTDFDASGSMSYSSVTIVLNAVNPSEDTNGTMVFVMKRQGRNWRIRSQTLVLN